MTAVSDDLGCNRRGTVVAVEHELESTRERPEELENRDVKRDTRYGQPNAGHRSEQFVHGTEERKNVAMLHHHALRLAC